MAEPIAEKTLLETWTESAAPPLLADGSNNPKIPYNIVGNEAFLATVNTLAEKYLPVCEEKFKLLHEKRDLEKKLGDDDADWDTIDASLKKIDQLIKQFDVDLVQTNAGALKKIIDCEGFNKLFLESGKPEAERTKAAVLILSPLIQYAVAAACEHSGYIIDIRDDPRLLGVTKTIVPRSLGAGS